MINQNVNDPTSDGKTTARIIRHPSHNPVLAAALTYASLGIPIFPLHPTEKKALITRWQERATTDEQQIRKWFRKFPDMRTATPAGAKSGLIALDLDRRDGKDGRHELAKLEAIHGGLPDTLEVTTPSGGTHKLFSMPRGLNVYNRASDIGPGIDVRGSRADGSHSGVLPLAPSPGPDGTRYELPDGWEYCWDLRQLPEAPAWLLFQLIFNRTQRGRLAALGITKPENFGAAPASDWERIGREKLRGALRTAHGATPDGPLPAEMAERLQTYIERAITGELDKVRHAQVQSRDSTINTSAMQIWSLLHGAGEWTDTASLIAETRKRFLEAASELGDDDKAGPFEDIAAEKFERTADEADPRDLTHIVVGTTADDDFADIPVDDDGAAVKGDPFAKVFGKSAAQWIGVDPKPARFVVDKIVPEGFVTLLAAAGGRGKSLISLQAMVCVAAGVQLLGYDVAPGKAAAIFCEDEPEELHRRTKAICGRLGVDFEQVANRLWPSSRVGMDAVLWTDKGAVQRKLDSIREAVASQPELKLLILDGVSFLFAAPEMDRGHVTRFIAALTSIAQAGGFAILLIHHESKTSSDSDTHAASGSTAWINACRSVLKLALVEGQPDKRALLHIKSNRGQRQLPVTCSIDGSGFHSLSGDRQRQQALHEAVQRLMREASDAGVNLSPNANSSLWYAPKWLTRNQGPTDFTADDFKRAIGDLMSFRLAEIETYENKGVPCERYKLCIEN